MTLKELYREQLWLLREREFSRNYKQRMIVRKSTADFRHKVLAAGVAILRWIVRDF